MVTPINESVNSIAKESPSQNEAAPSTEGSTSQLVGEIGAEKVSLNTSASTDDDTGTKPTNTKTQDTHIVDKTAGVTPIHPVDEHADKLTTLADKDEEEFIEGVETAHHEHN